MPSLKKEMLNVYFGRECPTLARLRTIARGERVRYYLGNLAEDLKQSRSAGVALVCYTSNLQQIIDLVERLTGEERIRTYTKTEKRLLPHGNPVTETHYYAIGI